MISTGSSVSGSLLTSQDSPKRTQQQSSCPTTLIFMLCTVTHPLILRVIPHTKRKNITKPHRTVSPPTSSHGFLSTPPVAQGRHVTRDGASEHSSRKTTRTRAARVHHPGCCSQKRLLRLFADPGSWVASGIAQFWNLMQERSHGAFDF